MVNLALVGCAHIHTPGFLQTIRKRPDIRLKLVWDHDPERAARRAAEADAAVAPTLADLWADTDISGVIICSETVGHEPLVTAAAAAGKHLFVEKPLGMGAEDGYRMAAAIRAAGVLFQTGYFRRGDPVSLFLKQQIDAGLFGRITRIRGSNCHSGALGGWFDKEWRWMADVRQAGVGAFGDLGTHMLDLMLWMLGDVTMATAMLDRGTARYGDCDETGEGLMRFQNGAIGTLAAAWDDLADPVSLLVSGTEAHAAVIRGKLHLKTAKLPGADGKEPWTDLPAPQPAGLDAFLDAITGKGQPALVAASEAAYRSAVMEAMYRGAATGTWVRPQQPLRL